MNRFCRTSIWALTGCVALACQPGAETNTASTEAVEQAIAEITYIHQIDGFSSGSGMAQLQGTYYAVGDDDAYLWRFDNAGTVLDKWQVWDTVDVVNNRIRKRVKPDFEAVCTFPFAGDTVLLIFGSGSKSPRRDVLLMASAESADTAAALPASERFYSWLRQAASLGPKGLNLEGAAFSAGLQIQPGGELILLNRHNNELYRLPAQGFGSFLQSGDTSLLSLSTQRYVLPQIGGDSARFSGASLLPDGRTLLFSASIEATTNAIDDGKILGSFVGTLDLGPEATSAVVCRQVFNADGRAFTGKVEAVEGYHEADGALQVVGITDNDDGTTMFLRMEMR